MNQINKTMHNGIFVVFIIFGFTMFIALCLPIISNATAVTGFDAGRIIDDAVFTNSSSMNVDQIQAFLNSKNPDCDTDGSHPASDFGRSDLTHAQYAASRGWPGPPYPCLKDYNENGLGSAQIIYNVAQQYLINPQVLIVLLQKEQSLVTDTWPLPVQYRTATGYACGDNSACETAYFGLTRQLHWAGTLFHTIITNSQSWSNPYRSGTSWYSPYILGNNTIYYNPGPYDNSAGKYYGNAYDKDGKSIADRTYCGGSTVNIQNRATQALYDYTPYQPNSATLNANWGDTVFCGAYGNLNFYLYFSDWFGSTYSYSWQWGGQNVYTDSSKTTTVDSYNQLLTPNTRYYLTVKAKNIGGLTWNKSDFRLGTTNPLNHSSAICDSTWINCGRPAALVEDSVAPGQTGTFEFWITTPGPNQSVKAYFDPLRENVAWANDIGMHFVIKTK
jgi:hypothetical protein